MKLTLRKSDFTDDWYVIERMEHDNRTWFEPLGDNAMQFCTSSRFSDADVEGTLEEMGEIAKAIRERGTYHARRCAVDARGDSVTFESPRNSTVEGVCTYDEALALAELIDRQEAANRERVDA